MKSILRNSAIAALLMTCLVSCGQRIEEWKSQKTEEINAALADTNHPFRQMVQERHLTVKVRDAKVAAMEVQPHHDFSWTGWDNCNIKSFEVDITFTWDGIIHKNGETVLRVAMLLGATEAEYVKVIRSDAAINLGNEEEWQKLRQNIQSLFKAPEAQ